MKNMMFALCALTAVLSGGCRMFNAAGGGDSMETRVYGYVPFFVCGPRPGRPISTEADWKEWFSPRNGCNVTWPAGSGIKVKANPFALVITNTRTNLDVLTDWHLRFSDCSLMVDMKMRVEGEGKVLAEPHVLTRAGHQAFSKSVVEYIYPQDFDVVVKTNYCAAVEPQNFTVRESGVIVDVTPEVDVDAGRINIALKVEFTGEPQWKDYGETLIAPNGDKYTLPMEQPFFPVRQIDTHLSLVPGEPVTIGDKSLSVTVLPRLVASGPASAETEVSQH